MASPISAILLAIQTAVAAWAADTTPVKGDAVVIAGDALEGYQKLSDTPRGYRIVLWYAGDKPVSGKNDAFVNAILSVGIAIAKGLTQDPRSELVQATATRPPALDIIEGVTALMRGLHVGGQPASENDTCWLLRYAGGSEWLKYEVPASHYVHQLNFTLPRQLPARNPRAVVL